MTLNDWLGWLIVLLGAAIAFFNIRFYIRCRSTWRWIKLMYGLVGLMYCVFYLTYMLDVLPTAMPYTRSLTTVTLGVLLSGSIVSERSRLGGCDGC
jgi:hypothetical protein